MLFKTVKCLMDVSHSYSFLLVSNRGCLSLQPNSLHTPTALMVLSPKLWPPWSLSALLRWATREVSRLTWAFESRKRLHCTWNFKPATSESMLGHILGEMNKKSIYLSFRELKPLGFFLSHRI